MFHSNDIMIISPPQYADLARLISHEISKIEDCASTFWTIPQYIANEINMTNGQYAIFIGNHEENILSKNYFPAMETVLPANKAGIFYAYNSTKAIVFGEGKLEQISEFKKLYKGIKNGEVIVDEDSSKANNVGSYLVASALLGLLGVGFMFIFKFYSKKKKENKLRREQTKLALTLFLSGNFKGWLNIKDEVSVEDV